MVGKINLLLDTQKRNEAKNEFDKDFNKLLNNSFYGKTMQNVGNRLKVEFTKKRDKGKIIKQQSKLTGNRNHNSNTNYDSCTIKQNEALMEKPENLGFAILEMSKLLLYET